MRIDAHIHSGLYRSYTGATEEMTEKLVKDLNTAGFGGAVLLSADPLKFTDWSPEKRIEDVKKACGGRENFYPFYWINPLESDAVDQVKLAVDSGIAGFKMICSNYYPGCRESMDVLAKAAELDKPVLFHSGDPWDGRFSGDYNRPGNFEALIDIPKLRFALAHVSWVWYDECIAVYGKFNNAYGEMPETCPEMFVDLTPGTPRPWRDEVFKRLFWSEYEFKYNLMFGTDSMAEKYNISWAKEWQERDDSIWPKYMPAEEVEDFLDHVYYKNILRFMHKSDEQPERKVPPVGA